VTEVNDALEEVVYPGAEQLGSGTIVDLTTAYQISQAFKLGLNAADYSMPNDNAGGMGYSGVALYSQYAVSENFLIQQNRICNMRQPTRKSPKEIH